VVNSGGSNMPDRWWKTLTAAGAEELIRANLSTAFHGAIAALPIMRRQKDGVVALSHSINMEECRNGIRSTALSPGEVATPILAKRPVPVSDEDKARMLQSEDLGDLIRYIACLPPRVCL